jgi:hypothetical protein
MTKVTIWRSTELDNTLIKPKLTSLRIIAVENS